jgi:hypothetical protein
MPDRSVYPLDIDTVPASDESIPIRLGSQSIEFHGDYYVSSHSITESSGGLFLSPSLSWDQFWTILIPRS